MFVTTVTFEGQQIGYAEAETYGTSRHQAMDSISDDHIEMIAGCIIETREQVEVEA